MISQAGEKEPRRPSAAPERCPVGLQIIGPVPSATCWDREFADSPLEQRRFELSVPP
jgi:hypothetical protein